MATYSTNLALTLLATGEGAGTWGNTTNTNLGTLLEQAISGYTTQAVATGTDTTLTMPNGTTAVARNMYIELTGTGGAATNLIVPANKKLYFIFNNSTGAVTVKVTGQTGVSVPAGEKMLLVNNGTDVVNAVTYIADLGTNSLSVTTLSAVTASITTASGTTLRYTSGAITNLSSSSLVVFDGTFASATVTTLLSTSATITTLTSPSATITTLSSTSATIANLGSTSANITTLTGTNASLTSLTLTNALRVSQGGTGSSATPTNGQLLIGNGTGFSLSTLTAGVGVSIANNAGSITITAAGTGFITGVTASSPLASSGGSAPDISIALSTGTGAVVLASGANFSAASANITTLTGTNFSATSLTLTNALRVAEGGTGVDSTPTNGQLLIGNGTGFTLATLTAGTGISVTNNAGSITISGGALPTVTVTSSTAITAAAGVNYVLSGASATVTLPASPTISDTIYVTVANSLTVNKIARNGKPIQGLAEDMILNAPYASAQLRFTNDTIGWVLV